MIKIWTNLQTLDRLHRLIKRKATGNNIALSNKLEVSRSTIFEYIAHLRSLGADIHYCNSKESYYYKNDFSLSKYIATIIGNDDDIKGGINNKNYFENNFQSPNFLDYLSVCLYYPFERCT